MNENYALDNVWAVDKTIYENKTNITLKEFLLKIRGPQHLALTIVVPITVLYILIFISGVIGNLAVCLVIIKNKLLHNTTNYYLFSLAVSDLTLLLLGLPYDLRTYWQQYPWQSGVAVCKVRALVSEMTSYTSVLTIVAFSTERYLAICHPLLHYSMSGLRRAIWIITALWIASFVCAFPFAALTKVHYAIFKNKTVEESAFCCIQVEDVPSFRPICELSFFFYFLLPLLIILLLYCLIGLKIRSRSVIKRPDTTVHGDIYIERKKAIILMLAAVVVTFFVCWAPYHAQRLYYFYGKDTGYYYKVNEYLYYLSGGFYYFSSTANPILYNLMSDKYREGFRRTFLGERRRQSSAYGKKESSLWKKRTSSYQVSEPEISLMKLLAKNEPDLVKTGELHGKGKPQEVKTTEQPQESSTQVDVTIDHCPSMPPSPSSGTIQLKNS